MENMDNIINLIKSEKLYETLKEKEIDISKKLVGEIEEILIGNITALCQDLTPQQASQKVNSILLDFSKCLLVSICSDSSNNHEVSSIKKIDFEGFNLGGENLK